MTSSPNPTAAIIVIGDEILSGRTKDKNIGWLAEQLGAQGIQLCEARVIADKKQVIIDTVQTLSKAYDLVFTSGGIGPTHDDITTDAVAAAFGVPVIRHPEAERRLILHYANTDLEFNAARQKMADIPNNAVLIDNPLSAAPGYIIGNVHVLPGVPTILQAMFEGLKPRLPGGIVMTRITVQCATGEGNIATILSDVEASHDGVSVGSYPWMKPGNFGTAVVVSGLDAEITTAAAKAVEAGVRAFGAAANIVNADGTLQD
ncbi:MAG: molybdopterin-binding protein [Proteobacteria bacterium]|nr:molybdopterin-binding protein [Pseudomonadota bacterium]MDA0961192.1 molybdopterin-binding protein [Pseudomonadota bacterium]MDA1152212.1 molybdopterin-binding protein [Pseudomonadota bacterium]